MPSAPIQLGQVETRVRIPVGAFLFLLLFLLFLMAWFDQDNYIGHSYRSSFNLFLALYLLYAGQGKSLAEQVTNATRIN